MPETRSWITGRLVLGLVIIAVGVLLALDNLNLLDSEPILRWWPAVLLAFGLAKLTGWGMSRNTVAGLLMSAIGAWLLLGVIGAFPAGIEDLWPLALVALGVVIASGAIRRTRGDVQEATSDQVSCFAFWSGVGRKVASTRFLGGDATAIMGGVEIDLRQARATAGVTPVIEVLVVMGGVELRVPEDWTVRSDALVVMGGLEDNTKPSTAVATQLVLRGLVMMGGIELKN